LGHEAYVSTAERPAASAQATALPPAYAEALRAACLAPLWHSMRSLIPEGTPARRARPTHWPYADIKALLLQSGDLAPIELAERRALVLCNPGYGDGTLRATPSIFVGFQLLLPGETAANHRHVATALRLVVEGRGGYTTVSGRRLAMERGDLLLTPGGCWHEHGQDGVEPVLWLDALDVPIVHHLEVSTSDTGTPQRATEGDDAAHVRFPRAGLVPYAELGSRAAYPILRFPWSDARSALVDVAAASAKDAAVHLAYVNPSTGEECLPTLGCSALMLRPAEERSLMRRSASAALYVIEGRGTVDVDGSAFDCEEHDVVAVPTHARVQIRNRSLHAPAFVFIVDDAPLQRKLQIYRELA
jgi:gentisate 1,2-dioxygenase